MTDNEARLERAQRRLAASANRLAKWRSWFAGWQLGTQSEDHGPAKAVRDHREVTMMLRAEVSGLTKILLDKGVVSEVELAETFADEYEMLSADYSRRFDGVEATGQGLTMDIVRVRETMRRLGFPP